MKSQVKMIWSAGIAMLFAVLFSVSCRKDSLSGTSGGVNYLQVYLTDDPCPYDSVFIDIQVVEVKIDTTHHWRDGDDDNDHDAWEDKDDDDDHKGCDNYGQWDTLQLTPGVYNIMALRNGVDTLLAQGGISAGSIRKIRLTLGTNNSVVVSGTTYPLHLYPGTDPYVYLKLDEEDMEDHGHGKRAIWIDFDVCQSIIFLNGQYYLKPVVKTFVPNRFGSVEGEVHPSAAHPFITIYNAQDTATAIPEDDDGEYKIRGLLPGSYSLWFHGTNGYRDTTLYNIVVYSGRTTEVKDVTLLK